MQKHILCTFIALIGFISTPTFSNSFFEDWGPSVETYTQFGLAHESGLGVRVASDYPDSIKSFSLRVSHADTGNVFQYVELQKISLAMSGTFDKPDFTYELSLNNTAVDVFTASTTGTGIYAFSSFKARGELSFGELPWADEAYVVVGGTYENRFKYTGMLPYDTREQSVLLGINIKIKIPDIIGLDLLSFAVETTEVDAPNQYSGVSLINVCDVGFQNPRSFRIDGQKKLNKLLILAHVGVGEDSCSDKLSRVVGVGAIYTF